MSENARNFEFWDGLFRSKHLAFQITLEPADYLELFREYVDPDKDRERIQRWTNYWFFKLFLNTSLVSFYTSLDVVHVKLYKIFCNYTEIVTRQKLGWQLLAFQSSHNCREWSVLRFVFGKPMETAKSVAGINNANWFKICCDFV